MNKEEYFEKSNKLNIPKTCPIFDYCERRAITVLANSYYENGNDKDYIKKIIKDGYLPDDYSENFIKMKGETPSWTENGFAFSCKNMCPEVNLFDKSNSKFDDVACSSGYLTYENKVNTVKIYETKHYSECNEFKKFKIKG